MIGFALQWIKDNVRRQEGQTMAEYGLILALIAVAVAGVMLILGGQIKDVVNSVVSHLSGSSGTTTTP